MPTDGGDGGDRGTAPTPDADATDADAADFDADAADFDADAADADATDAADAADADATDRDAEDLTALARELYDLPFHREHGVEVVSVTAEHARTRWPFEESLVGNPEVPAVHGGVVSALADLTGAIPFVADAGGYTPTVDLRVDYLSHAGAADLHGEATVLRRGGSVGVADVTVRSGGKRCAVARGVYKLPDGDEKRGDGGERQGSARRAREERG